jgi:hypothetical protein
VATAPYQLWVDCPAVVSAIRVSTTVTVTTVSAHSIVTGSVIALEGLTGAAGTSMNAAWTVASTPSGTTFTFTAAGSAGTATATDDDGTYIAALSQDVLNPLINYSGTARNSALYVPTESIQMAASGDGAGATMSFAVRQDDTPTDGPWYLLTPDEARIRLIQKDTGASPASDGSDVLFLGTINGVTARLNGAGQGTEADVQVADVNAVLDRLVIFGKPVSSKQIASEIRGGIERAANVVTVRTTSSHGYTVGMPFTITGVLGGEGTSFNTSSTIASVPSSTTFTFSQSGSAANGYDYIEITTAARATSRSANVVRLTMADAHGLKGGESIKVVGVKNTVDAVERLIDSVVFSGQNVRVVNATQIDVTLATRRVASFGTFSTPGQPYIRFEPVGSRTVTPGAGSNQGSIGLNGNESESGAVQKMLGVVAANKSDDYALNRLLKTTTTTQISGSTKPNQAGLVFPAGTLRAALDSVVEAYSGMDSKDRRYFVDTRGRLDYRLVDTTAVPTYATAPYKIITTGTQDPNTTTAAATIIHYNLGVDWDFRTTKEALVVTSSIDNSPGATRVQNYIDSGYTLRPISPRFDEVVEAPTRSTNVQAELGRVATAFFLERHKPILSGSLTIRGRGTESFNEYGFNSGYAQTGASTFALVEGWKPGQWMDVTCAELGLSGLYRIEQVDWTLEPGSFTSAITITFNRRPASSLTHLLNAGGK